MTETVKKPTIAEAVKTRTQTVAPDYQQLYVEECAKNKALETKLAECEKICKTYAERDRETTATLQRATIEYNARIKYMLDCARHAFLSMQFATAATETKQGGEQ